MKSFESLSALECAQYALDEFMIGGRAVAVEDNGVDSVRVKRGDGMPDVCLNGNFAYEINKRRTQKPE